VSNRRVCKQCGQRPSSYSFKRAFRITGDPQFHTYANGCFHRYEPQSNLEFLEEKLKEKEQAETDRIMNEAQADLREYYR
jgi:hypothetical protein